MYGPFTFLDSIYKPIEVLKLFSVTPKMEKQISELQRSMGDVSLTLTKHILQSKEGKECNVVFSPFSIQVILSLIASGSKAKAREELLTFLKAKSTDELNSLSSYLIDVVFANGSSSSVPLESSADGVWINFSKGPFVSMANGVWIDKSLSFKTTFKNVVDHVYKAASDVVDFQNKPSEATNLLNSWVEKETNGLIKDIFPPGSVNTITRLVYANAIYFKGVWLNLFNASITNDYDFYLLNGSSIQVPFMIDPHRNYQCSASEGFRVLRLPYRQGNDKQRQFSMYIFLPNAKDGLPTLVEKLGSESGFLDRHITSHKDLVGSVKIPKFKISFGFEVSDALKGLGLVSQFSQGQLTEMVNESLVGQMLYVTNTFHKSSIEVNETGTEAAAAFGAICGGGSAPPGIDFVADHPFFFLVREDVTGVVLFVGQVLNPLAT